MKILPKGLRARSTVAFALLALGLSMTLSIVTYEMARSYLLNQREQLATRQVMVNALVAKELVAAADASPDGVLESLKSVSSARAVLRFDDTWFAAVVELSESTIPSSLITAVTSDGAARQRTSVNGTPYLVVGVELPGLNAAYFEFVTLIEYERTLSTLATVLVAGASLTTVAGAIAGYLASRRVMRPLADVAQAAQAMSAGDLTRRLHVGRDQDLEPVAESFNDMALSLENRIERELRFTADVSHELRTPLTAMASAVSLAKRADLSGRAKFAVDVLDEQVEHLSRLTLELLEIAKIDAGVADLRIEEVDVEAVVRRVLESAATDPAVLESRLDGDLIHRLDKTRFERVMANLIENADRYGGGARSVVLERRDGELFVWVDDAGPGVPLDERVAIFGRFHRGAFEQPQDRPKGTGLGLALVDEHVKLHGGSAWVTDSPQGGARFVIRIPRLSE